jgi:hypothetical protein
MLVRPHRTRYRMTFGPRSALKLLNVVSRLIFSATLEPNARLLTRRIRNVLIKTMSAGYCSFLKNIAMAIEAFRHEKRCQKLKRLY